MQCTRDTLPAVCAATLKHSRPLVCMLQPIGCLPKARQLCLSSLRLGHLQDDLVQRMMAMDMQPPEPPAEQTRSERLASLVRVLSCTQASPASGQAPGLGCVTGFA